MPHMTAGYHLFLDTLIHTEKHLRMQWVTNDFTYYSYEGKSFDNTDKERLAG